MYFCAYVCIHIRKIVVCYRVCLVINSFHDQYPHIYILHDSAPGLVDCRLVVYTYIRLVYIFIYACIWTYMKLNRVTTNSDKMSH